MENKWVFFRGQPQPRTQKWERKCLRPTPTWTPGLHGERKFIDKVSPTLLGYPLNALSSRRTMHALCCCGRSEHCSRAATFSSNLKAMLFTDFLPEKFEQALSWSFRYIAARLPATGSCGPPSAYNNAFYSSVVVANRVVPHRYLVFWKAGWLAGWCLRDGYLW